MQLAVAEISEEDTQLETLNDQLRVRAEKFGSSFTPLSLTDFKLFKIRKAQETGDINYLSNILLEQVQDLQERKQKISQRIQQFYPELKVQTEDKFFEEKVTPANTNQEGITIRPNVWSLFGVDYMSNEIIRNYFHINPHFKIEWINDSSCNLVFNSDTEAQEAVLPLAKGEGMRDENEVWYELPEYEVEGVKRKLFCRLATSLDVKDTDRHGHKSQYYRWMINKQKLTTYVKRKAHGEIMKKKGINRDGKHHQHPESVETKREKREKREEESSSSGVQDSEEMEG